MEIIQSDRHAMSDFQEGIPTPPVHFPGKVQLLVLRCIQGGRLLWRRLGQKGSLFLLVFGVWLGMILAGQIALFTIVYVPPDLPMAGSERSPLPASVFVPSTPAILPAPARAKPLVWINQSEKSAPLMSIVTIALGCAIGSMLVASRLRQSQYPRRLTHRSR
jgi:hypothetical protein